MKMHLQESNLKIFQGSMRTPLGSKALWAFGKCNRLLLLSTRFCKNLLKPLRSVKDINYSLALTSISLNEIVHKIDHSEAFVI